MAHTVIWDRTWDFRPIGSSPPTSLVRDIPPEKDADILLLGCGDPSNVLYTLHSSGFDDKNSTRKLDITCSDSEPAILARNIILYTLTMRDDFEIQKWSIWNIFYHFFLDTLSLNLLISQCKILAESSADLETWHASHYSKYLKIGTTLTLQELHKHWRWYARTEGFTEGHKAQLKVRFRNYQKKHYSYYRGFVTTAPARATGPVWPNGALAMNEAYHRYWETGVMFSRDQDIAAATQVNPVFAYSNHNEQFATNDFTSPLSTFLLAGTFCPLAPANASKWPQASPTDLYEAPRTQFSAWLRSFRASIQSEGKVTLRFVFGDALALGLTIQEFTKTGRTSAAYRVSPWRAPFLTLDGDGFPPDDSSSEAPVSFDVIDTCNTCDKLGILNVLVASMPLLRPHSWAVLYTKTDEVHGDDPTKDFWIQLCGDLGTMFLLFDLAPTSFLSGFRTEGNTQELVSRQLIPNPTTFVERLTWRRPSRLGITPSDQTLVLERKQMRDLLYNIYVKMFQREAFSYMTDTQGTDKERDRAHYCRRSLVLLIRYLASRVVVEWDDVVMDLVSRMGDPELVIGKISLHDFVSQLYQLGLYSADIFRPGRGLALPWDPRQHGCCRSWGVIPPMVYIAVEVPRSTFRILDRRDTPRDPPISAGIGSTAGNESYHFVALETFFGTLKMVGTHEHARGHVTEDPLGRRGNSPVILSLCVPSHILVRPSHVQMHVRLLILKTPHTDYFYEKYGNMGRFFDIPTSDPGVHVLAQKPATRKDSHIHEVFNQPIKRAKKAHDSAQVTLDNTCAHVLTMTIRAAIRDPNAKVALSDKATPVNFNQVGFRIIRLSIGPQLHQDVTFPFPVNGAKTRIRVSRRESWVEIITPPAQFGQSDRFPVIANHGATVPWNMHRIWLGKLPLLSVSNPYLMRWVNRHVNFSFTERELGLPDRNTTADPLTIIKSTINSMFKMYIGTQDSAGRSTITLTLPDGSIDSVVFIAGLKLDLAGHTVVLDAYVLPSHAELSSTLQVALNGLRSTSARINITKEGSAMWRYLLPSLAERCRDWKHWEDCAYAMTGQIPSGRSPLCECGTGKLAVSSLTGKRRDWAPFVPYLTKIALSPLFGVSYLEPMCVSSVKALENILGDHGVPVGTLRLLIDGGRVGEDHSDTFCETCMYWLPPGSRKACSGCESVVYCGKACQVFNWAQHRSQCKRIQLERRK